jgi:hypothetical protein
MKPRMQFLQSTISFMITQLKQNDNLAVVMYDSDVEVLLPLTMMDPEGKVSKETSCYVLYGYLILFVT